MRRAAILTECSTSYCNNVAYVGGDIVAPMIDALNANYSGPSIKFIHVDLTKGPLPTTDLMFCRDCMCHLSFADTLRVLQNFVRSGSRYLLASTNSNPQTKVPNKDIVSHEAARSCVFAVQNLWKVSLNLCRYSKG